MLAEEEKKRKKIREMTEEELDEVIHQIFEKNKEGLLALGQE